MTNSSTQEGEITLQHRTKDNNEQEDEDEENNSRIEKAVVMTGLESAVPATAVEEEEDEDVTLATTPEQEEVTPDALDALEPPPAGPKSDISSLRQKLEQVRNYSCLVIGMISQL